MRCLRTLIIAVLACLTIQSPAFAVYNAELGRWVSRDPVEYVDGNSLVNYVDNKPLVCSDDQGTMIGMWYMMMLSFCTPPMPVQADWQVPGSQCGCPKSTAAPNEAMGGAGSIKVHCSCANLLGIWIMPEGGDNWVPVTYCNSWITIDGYYWNGMPQPKKIDNGTCVIVTCCQAASGELLKSEFPCQTLVGSMLQGAATPYYVPPTEFGPAPPTTPATPPFGPPPPSTSPPSPAPPPWGPNVPDP